MVQNFEPQNLHSRKKNKQTNKQTNKKHLSITYINLPRKCDPLIYTYRLGLFIYFFFMKYLSILSIFFLFFLYLVLFFGLNMDKFKKKIKNKTKRKNKQTNFIIFVNFSKFVFVLFFFFDI